MIILRALSEYSSSANGQLVRKRSWQLMITRGPATRQKSAAICLLVLSDAAKFEQLAEEARKLKQAKKQARKERRKPPAPKPIDEAAARLAEHRAKVSKQERELQRAKAEQQKAELAAKRKMIQKERAAKADVTASSYDPDEGQLSSNIIFLLLL